MKINQTELAAFAENAPRAEVITSGATTTVYSGIPANPDPAKADTCLWTICRTVVTRQGSTTSVETTWARGLWADRSTLNYLYEP